MRIYTFIKKQVGRAANPCPALEGGGGGIDQHILVSFFDSWGRGMILRSNFGMVSTFFCSPGFKEFSPFLVKHVTITCRGIVSPHPPGIVQPCKQEINFECDRSHDDWSHEVRIVHCHRIVQSKMFI